MQFDNRQFHSVDDLVDQARASVAGGLTQRVRRDDQEIALAWLDRLAQRRSDWLPAIGATLVSLAEDGGDNATAVADFYATAAMGVALIDWLDLLLDCGLRTSTSVRSQLVRADGPLAIADLRKGLDEQVRWLRDPPLLWFDIEPSSTPEVADDAGLAAAVAESVAVGRPRMSGAFDPAVLGWLRHGALFSGRIRAALPGLVDDLLLGDEPKGQVVGLEYAVRAGDRRWCLDSLTILVDAAPAWLNGPVDGVNSLWPADQPPQLNLKARLPPRTTLAMTLGDLLEDAVAAAGHEVATAPRMSA